MSEAQPASLHALRVAAFTGGVNVPSARFRIRQYIGPLVRYGILIDERPSKVGQYPPVRRISRPLWLIRGVLERLPQVAARYRHDVILFQRELLSTFVTLEPFAARPRVLDVDDAIWLHRGGGFARRLGRLSDIVVCGNAFIADYFEGCGCRTFVLPTGVDTDRFVPRRIQSAPVPVIGWSGSGGNLGELERLEPAIRKLLAKHKNARLRVISNRAPRLATLREDQVEFVPWSPGIEVSALQGLSVGLMPLADDQWSRGKCAYKMLTYMACGIPVVVSPVGMNAEVLGLANVGFGARTEDEWVESIDALLLDPALAHNLGTTGRATVERLFSVAHLVGRFSELLLTVAR